MPQISLKINIGNLTQGDSFPIAYIVLRRSALVIQPALGSIRLHGAAIPAMERDPKTRRDLIYSTFSVDVDNSSIVPSTCTLDSEQNVRFGLVLSLSHTRVLPPQVILDYS